jgi:hypothetical protein
MYEFSHSQDNSLPMYSAPVLNNVRYGPKATVRRHLLSKIGGLGGLREKALRHKGKPHRQLIPPMTALVCC